MTNNWRSIEFKDVDLNAIEMTKQMRTQIKKFFHQVETNGLKKINLIKTDDKYGLYEIEEEIFNCKNLGDLLQLSLPHWGYGLNDIGFKTIQTVGFLINAMAKEAIFTNQELRIPRTPEQRRADTLAKYKKAYDMRQNGSTLGEIAEELETTRQTAIQMISKHRKEANIQPDATRRAQISENAMRKRYMDLVKHIGLLVDDLKAKGHAELAEIVTNRIKFDRI
jgi:hypothetical protein